MNVKNDNELIVYTDGGSRNNPGKAGIGFVIYNSANETLAEAGQYIGIKTNNEAEYTALLTALTHIKQNFPDCLQLHIFTDSELMARQLTGIYKIKEPNLKILAQQILSLLSTIPQYDINHVLRAKNKVADALYNKALDA